MKRYQHEFEISDDGLSRHETIMVLSISERIRCQFNYLGACGLQVGDSEFDTKVSTVLWSDCFLFTFLIS